MVYPRCTLAANERESSASCEELVSVLASRRLRHEIPAKVNGGWAHFPIMVLKLLESGTINRQARSDRYASGNLPSKEKCLRIGSGPADLESAEVFKPVALGYFRLRLDPKPELIEIRDAD